MTGKMGQVKFGRMSEVIFGKPAALAVSERVARMGAVRVMIVASGTLNRQTNVVENICASLGDKVVALFDQVPAHSPRETVVEMTGLARDVSTDLIVSIGGGSVTDAAKAVSLSLANDVRTADQLDALRAGRGIDGALECPAACIAPAVRQVAVPTTLSAGEFSAISGLTDSRSHVKELFWHPDMIPLAVVLDPSITVHTPEALFLSTGIRAIDHCVEGICSAQANPYTDAQALHGLRLLVDGLRRVKHAPDDLDARMHCQFGAWLSMAPVTSGVPMGASHGIGYVLGAAYGVPHGHTSCVMLPAVMRWNLPMTAERQAQIAATLGEADERAAAERVAHLIAELGMPRKLSDLEIGPESFNRIAGQAMETSWVPRNPRPIRGPADVVEILRLAT